MPTSSKNSKSSFMRPSYIDIRLIWLVSYIIWNNRLYIKLSLFSPNVIFEILTSKISAGKFPLLVQYRWILYTYEFANFNIFLDAEKETFKEIEDRAAQLRMLSQLCDENDWYGKFCTFILSRFKSLYSAKTQGLDVYDWLWAHVYSRVWIYAL